MAAEPVPVSDKTTRSERNDDGSKCQMWPKSRDKRIINNRRILDLRRDGWELEHING